MAGADSDWPIRKAAFDALAQAVRLHGPVLPWRVIDAGFTYRGQKVRYASAPRGIFRPAAMNHGALSIKTTVPKHGGPPKYADLETDDAFVYRLQGTDPDDYDNRQLLINADNHLPFIYFYGLEPRWYRPLWPAFATRGDDPLSCVVLVADEVVEPGAFLADPLNLRFERRYATVLAKKRLHQDAFRHRVLDAYQTRCAVCRLPRRELIEAAHIVPDRDVRGTPRVQNGLALCGLHHGAFDANLMGVRPDRIVEFSPRILAERDGPTLEHAIKGFHLKPLAEPTRVSERPETALLEERYRAFQRAG